jgi:hypothetical protein
LCALASKARLKEDESHSKTERDLVKYCFDKLNVFKHSDLGKSVEADYIGGLGFDG